MADCPCPFSYGRASWTRLYRRCSVSLIANFESLSSPMTRVYLANEPFTRNDAIATSESRNYSAQLIATRGDGGWNENLATSSGFSEAFSRRLRDESRSGIPREVPSTFSLERARTCRMWRRNPLGGTKKFSDPSRAPWVGARARSPSSCCPPFEKISRVFVRQDVHIRDRCTMRFSRRVEITRNGTIQRLNYQATDEVFEDNRTWTELKAYVCNKNLSTFLSFFSLFHLTIFVLRSQYG